MTPLQASHCNASSPLTSGTALGKDLHCFKGQALACMELQKDNRVETNWICRPGCYLYTVAQRAYQGGPGSRLNLPQARSKPKWLPVGPFRITSYITWHAFWPREGKEKARGIVDELPKYALSDGKSRGSRRDEGSTGLKLASSPVRCCLKMIAISAPPKHLASRWRRAGLHSDPAF